MVVFIIQNMLSKIHDEKGSWKSFDAHVGLDNLPIHQ